MNIISANSNAQCSTSAIIAGTDLGSGYYQSQNTVTLPSNFFIYSWDFGDGNTQIATGNYPVYHQYSFNGVYIVTLIVYNSDSTDCAYGIYTINVTNTGCYIEPDFTSFVDPNGVAHFTDQTIDSSAGGSAITGWNWSFGDGSISNLQNPSHQYTANGNYLVCLTVTNQNGCTDTICNSVLVTTSGCGINTVFTSIIDTGSTINFFATATGGLPPYTYVWNFGDGPNDTTTSTSISHTYTGPNSVYTVCVYAIDANQCAGSSCNVVYTQCANTYASFYDSTVTNTFHYFFGYGYAGGATITNYSWDFGDGSSILSAPTYQQIGHTFPLNGTFNVCLTVTFSNSCTDTYCYSISTVPCTITATVTQNTSGSFVILTGTPLNGVAPYTYSWSNGANGQSITVTNTSIGTYCFYATDANGCSASACTVVYPPSACAITFYTYNWNDSTYIYSSNAGQNINYTIDFGDGSPTQSGVTSTQYFQYAHQYASSGNYNVCIYSSNGSGCTDTVCNSIYACQAFDVTFSYSNIGNVYTFTADNPDTALFYTWIIDNVYYQGTSATHTFLTGGDHYVTLNADGQCYDSTTVLINIALLNADTLSGYLWNDANGNGLYDTGETFLSQSYVYLCDAIDSNNCIYAYTDANGYYQFIVSPGTYTITSYYYGGGNYYQQTSPISPTFYTVTTTGNQNITGFNFGYQNQASTLCGNVFYDLNNNGVQDAGENGVPYTYVKIDGWWVYTDAFGHYSQVVLPGSHTIMYVAAPSGYSVSTVTNYTVTTVVGQTLCGNNFGIWTDPDLQNLCVNVSPWTTVTPGFGAWYYISYCNYGATAMSGTVTLNWDANLELASVNPFSPNATTVSGNTATWNFTNLQPGECDYIYFDLEAPTTLALGSQVMQLVTISPISGDDFPLNNIDTVHQTVVGSWDPNDKQVSPPGVGIEGKILAEQNLTYTIQFQNTGTAPAVNVVLVDTLTDDLDLTSFRMNAASDPYVLSIDPTSRIIKWYFNNIMLPDSGSDFDNSIGFVEFSIDPVNNIAQGTVINNFADIYFDFNEPVRTNTTVNTIDKALTVKNLYKDASVSVYPNPFTDATQFFVRTTNQTDISIVIYNVIGQQVKVLNGKSGESIICNDDELVSGIYTYTIKDSSANVISNGKLVVK